jgi:hypothetical protein
MSHYPNTTTLSRRSVANFHSHTSLGMISPINHGALGGGEDDSFKGVHFEKDILLTCVRWYVAYPLSYRQLEGMMQERGVSVDYSIIHRWVLKYAPQFEAVFYRRKRPVWVSWRMDETYIKRYLRHNLQPSISCPK